MSEKVKKKGDVVTHEERMAAIQNSINAVYLEFESKKKIREELIEGNSIKMEKYQQLKTKTTTLRKEIQIMKGGN